MAQPDMPMIPGLAGTDPSAAAPQSIAALLDALPDDEFAALQDAADAAMAAGELDGLLGAAPVEGDDDEAAETPEDELAETDEQQAAEEEEGVEDPAPHIEAAIASADAATADLATLSTMVEEAAEHEDVGVDLGGLEDLLKGATDDEEEARAAADDVDGEEDAKAAAACAVRAADSSARVADALARARDQIGREAADVEKTAVPDDVKAMMAWAKSQQLGGG